MEPLIAALAGDGALVSVDTYKPAVAEAAIAAGAAIINDVSGLRDPSLAEVCARGGAALVIMHTRVEPKGTLLDPATYDDVVADVVAFLRERIDVAVAARDGRRGADPRSRPGLRQDAGADRGGAAPARRAARARAARCCSRSRARTSSARSPAARRPSATPGTLAAVAAGVDAGAAILRVHDVAGVGGLPRGARGAARRPRCSEPLEGLHAERYPDGVSR